MRVLAAAFLVLLSAGCLGSGGGGGGTAPTGTAPSFGLEPFLSSAAGLDNPVFLTHAQDGSGRLFLVEQRGVIRLWEDGQLRAAPYLDIAAGGPHAKVLAGGERGLLGLAFHPAFKDNGRLFLHYTAPGGDITIAEARADPKAASADAGSVKVLLSIEHSKYANHNGGMLAFGPDGFLYAGVGDGGASSDPDNNAQDLGNLLGKVLRLDVDGDCGEPVCVPADNPLVGRDGRDEIWAWGLRNPWRFSFDRGTGDLWIGDVGQNQWEEVDRAPAGQGGQNFGWSRYEGTHVHRAGRTALEPVDPVLEYDHGDGGASHCSVTGGYVYRGQAIPGLVGHYVFADYCSGHLWTFKDGVRSLAHQTGLNISSLGEDEAGELYVVDHGGAVRKLVPA